MLVSAVGEISRPAGRPADPVFPRSANKPIQAAGMTRSGLGLDGELLALAAASHSGEPFHVAGVTAIQRINTKGGQLEGTCDKAGATFAAPYAADYVFLRK